MIMRMKLLITGLLLSTCFAFAEQPNLERVYSIVKQRNSISWYNMQARLWKEQVDKNNTNSEAWFNYYSAKKLLHQLGGTSSQADLNKIAVEIELNIPNTFVDHYVKYWNATDKTGLFNHIETAYNIDPDRPETYDELITHYEIERDKAHMKLIADKWFKSNDISANTYAWNYNMLVSVEKNAIIITGGDNDTYPAMVLQNTKDIRPDVAVMNINLLVKKEYQDKYFTEVGVSKMEKDFNDYGNIANYQRAICQHLFDHSFRTVYFSPAINRNLYAHFKVDLYNVGLAFKFSKNKFDNIAVTKKNFEKHYLKDYLKTDLYTDLSASINDDMNASYLLPLLTLHNHYRESESYTDLNEVENLVMRIAEKTGQTNDVAKILNKVTSSVVSMTIKDPRKAYLGFLKVDDTLHVSQREVEKGYYDRFLQDLLKQGRYDELNIAGPRTPDWMALLDDKYKSLSFDKVFEHGKPTDDGFPVCNISKEAAIMYCDWLTNIYNNLEHKRKRYKKVKFRLPTEKEWEYLATAGKGSEINKYGWCGHNVRNGRGCFLANIKASVDDKYTCADKKIIKSGCPAHEGTETSSFDGGIFPVKVSSYTTNDFNLYGITGNVAEMVVEDGIAKGGSWNQPSVNCTTTSRLMYDGPSPEVGFRVVMTVIEK